MKRPAIALLALALALAGAAAAAEAPLRDPFARPAPAAPAAAPAAQPAPQLRAIMFEPGHSLANIGGQILGVGDWFGDYRVARIDARSVTLARGGAAVVLALYAEGK